MDSSLNLNTLASSLPTPYQNAEKDLLNNFKAAALSITTLYRSSRKASKRAYNAGYASALNDILLMIQQGVSVEGIEHASSGSSDNPQPSPSASFSGVEGQGMTIGKVMDWIEARMDAIKSREEEEDEEEEREREKERGNSNVAGSATTTNSSSHKLASRASNNNNRQTRDQGSSQNLSPADATRVSPSPPPATLRQTQRSHRSSRTQGPSKGDSSLPSSPQVPSVDSTLTPNFISPGDHAIIPSMTSSPPLSVSAPFSPFPDNVSAVAAGAKRRHAVMMMLDSSTASPSLSTVGSSSSTPNGSPTLHGHNVGSRRRTRSTRSNNQNLGLTSGLASEAMDVEEDGRERKRVARR